METKLKAKMPEPPMLRSYAKESRQVFSLSAIPALQNYWTGYRRV
jgi:hypothetical protein